MLSKQDRYREALTYLRKAEPCLGKEREFERLVLRAEMMTAQEDRQYELVLEKAEALARLDPFDRQSQYNLAGAYSTLYSAAANPQTKQAAMAAIAAGDRCDESPDPARAAEARRFRQQILYELSTGRVVKRDEFQRLFPDAGQNGEAR